MRIAWYDYVCLRLDSVWQCIRFTNLGQASSTIYTMTNKATRRVDDVVGGIDAHSGTSASDEFLEKAASRQCYK